METSGETSAADCWIQFLQELMKYNTESAKSLILIPSDHP